MGKNLQKLKLYLTFANEIINIVLTINNKVMEKNLAKYIAERKERLNKVLNKTMDSAYDMEWRFEEIYSARKEMEYLEMIESNAEEVISIFKRDLLRIDYSNSSSMMANVCRLLDDNVKRKIIRNLEYL